MTETTVTGPIGFDHHRGRAPLLRETSNLRGYVFVTASLAGFVAANAFLYYLCTGTWLDFSAESYRKALATPLTAMLTEPLSIFAYPWMIAVVGLLVGVIVFVPVAVAVLYRLWLSGLFVLTVALVGHAPILSAFLAGGCALATMTPLRSNQPFLAVLMGLCPVLLYVFLMFYLLFDTQANVLFPRDWVVLLPFLLALTAAVGASAGVLALARVTQFRPGIIWPVLYVFLLAPLLVFHARIGPVEMDYALVVAEVSGGMGDNLFAPMTIEEFRKAHPGVLPERAQDDSAALALAVNRQLDQRRKRLLARCADFLRRYRPNPRTPVVMWVRASAVDVRVDEPALRRGVVGYASVSPSKQSVGSWLELSETCPWSPQAGVAEHRLAIEALRDGRVQKAWEHLHVAHSMLRRYLDSQEQTPEEQAKVFAPREPLPGRNYYGAVLEDADLLTWLMEVNHIPEGKPEEVEAMAEYLRRWPFRDAASADLDELARRFEKTELADNFRFQAAMAEPRELNRALKLSRLSGEGDDGAAQANYELGRLGMFLQDTAEWSVMQLRPAEEYLRLVPAYAPFHGRAQEHLAWLAQRRAARP